MKMNQMNRKILFRGKRADNGDWVEGNYLEVDTLRGCMSLIMGKNYDEEEKCITDHALVIPETVGQYTGLTDKNGRKIFEGDIVRRKERLFTVKYSTEQARFLAFRPNGLHDPIAVKYCEVIGNIHDNPELLKGE